MNSTHASLCSSTAKLQISVSVCTPSPGNCSLSHISGKLDTIHLCLWWLEHTKYKVPNAYKVGRCSLLHVAHTMHSAWYVIYCHFQKHLQSLCWVYCYLSFCALGVIPVDLVWASLLLAFLFCACWALGRQQRVQYPAEQGCHLGYLLCHLLLRGRRQVSSCWRARYAEIRHPPKR